MNSKLKELLEGLELTDADAKSLWDNFINDAKRLNIKNHQAYATAAITNIAKSKGLDSESQRFIDANGSLICPNSVITGSDVAMYKGSEIPNADTLGLDMNGIYKVYRPVEEMVDNDFNGKYVLDKHINDFEASTFSKYKDCIVGVAYDCVQDGTEIKGTIAFNDPSAIDDLEDGKKYLSAGYWYIPVLEKGVFNGQNYDIKMTQIKANHIAHVSNPRYKKAIVGDENTILKGEGMKIKNFPSLYKTFVGKLGMDENLAEKALSAMDEDEAKEAEKKAKDELDKVEADKKAKDEAEEEKKKAKDELEKLKEDSGKGLDSDAIAQMIRDAVDKEVNKMKGLDSALSAYTERYGKPDKAFDSADAVYNAILANEGISTTGKSLEQKTAMVEMLGHVTAKGGRVNIAMDSNTLSGDYSYLSKEDREILGV